MTKLEALNLALRAIGQSAVASVDTNDPDVAEWQNVFDTAERDILGAGYDFNVETVTLSVVNGKVPVGQYLRIVDLGNTDLTVRNNKVYNRATGAFVTTAIPNVQAVVDVDWEDIPHEFQMWIATRTALHYILLIKGPVAEASYYQSLEAQRQGRAEALYSYDYGNGSGINKLTSKYRS